MNTIRRATIEDYEQIVYIGRRSVAYAHKDSCPDEILEAFVATNYNNEVIKSELSDSQNLYFIIEYDNKPVGFSKMILNQNHVDIDSKSVAKLNRIYVLKEYYGLKLGYELLKFNIELASNNDQEGLWLFTWVGNERAIDFYLKTGFKIVGRHDFHVSGTHYNPNHVMFMDFRGRSLEQKG